MAEFIRLRARYKLRGTCGGKIARVEDTHLKTAEILGFTVRDDRKAVWVYLPHATIFYSTAMLVMQEDIKTMAEQLLRTVDGKEVDIG